MRPRGEVREAVVAAVTSAGVTLREVVERSGVGYDAARTALQNAHRVGELTIAGTRREPHSKRPAAVYKPSDVLDDLAGDWRDMADAIAAWR